MYRWVTRTVGPLAAVAAVTGVGAGAQARGGAPAWQRTTPQATRCPVDVAPPASAIPGASPSRDENPPSLKLALTAHGTRAPDADVVAYRITASPTRTPLHDVTVTAYLTCVPGDAWLVGRPSASTGRATAGPRAVTWRFDPGRTPATADFTVRVRPGARGGPLVGEVAATGPVSNCPALRAADTRIDAYCRVTVLLPGVTPPAIQAHPAPVPGTRAPAPLRAQGAPPAFPVTPPALPVPPAATLPGVKGALPVLPTPSPSVSPSVLSQLDRPPIVPTGPAGPDAVTQEALPLRSADSSRGDLGGRAFAFLIGGVAFLLLATAIGCGLIGTRLRRVSKDDETDAGPRIARRPHANGDRRTGGRPRGGDRPRDTALPGHESRPADDPGPRPASTSRTLPDVVRRTTEATDPPRPRLGTDPTLGYERPDPALGHERPLTRIVVDE